MPKFGYLHSKYYICIGLSRSPTEGGFTAVKGKVWHSNGEGLGTERGSTPRRLATTYFLLGIGSIDFYFLIMSLHRQLVKVGGVLSVVKEYLTTEIAKL